MSATAIPEMQMDAFIREYTLSPREYWLTSYEDVCALSSIMEQKNLINGANDAQHAEKNKPKPYKTM